MSNVVKAKVKRYSKKIKNRSKNAKEPYRITETVNIGLSKSCNFQDEEDVYVLDTDTYEELNNATNTLNDKEKYIQELEKQIQSLEAKQINESNKEDSSDKITIINLMQEINDRNQQLYQADKNINKAIDEVINATVKAAQESYKDTVNTIIKNIVSDNERAVDLRNEQLVKYIKESADKVNEELNDSNIFKLLRNYRKFDFDIPTEELEKPVRFEVDISPLENLNLNIDSHSIKKNLKLEDLSKLWIETSLDDVNDARLIETEDIENKN